MHKCMSQHGDKDHAGDALYLLEHFKVKNIYMNLGKKTTMKKLLLQNMIIILPKKAQQ